MTGNLLTLMMMSIHQDPLDEIIAVLITRDYHALVESYTGLFERPHYQ